MHFFEIDLKTTIKLYGLGIDFGDNESYEQLFNRVQIILKNVNNQIVYNSFEHTKFLIESTDVFDGSVDINLIDDKGDDAGVGVVGKRILRTR